MKQKIYKSVDEMVWKMSGWRFKLSWFWNKLINRPITFKTLEEAMSYCEKNQSKHFEIIIGKKVIVEEIDA